MPTPTPEELKNLTPAEEDVLEALRKDTAAQTAPTEAGNTGNVEPEEEYTLPAPAQPRPTRNEALKTYLTKLEEANKEREEKNRLSDEELARRTRAKRLAANITDVMAALGQLYSGAKGARTVAVQPEFTDRFNAYYQREQAENRRKADEEYAAAAGQAEQEYNNAAAEIAALEKMDLENQKSANSMAEKEYEARLKSALSAQEYEQSAALNDQRSQNTQAEIQLRGSIAARNQAIKDANAWDREVLKQRGKQQDSYTKVVSNFEKATYGSDLKPTFIVGEDGSSAGYHISPEQGDHIVDTMIEASGVPPRTVQRGDKPLGQLKKEIISRIENDGNLTDPQKEEKKRAVEKAYQDGAMLAELDYRNQKLDYMYDQGMLADSTYSDEKEKVNRNRSAIIGDDLFQESPAAGQPAQPSKPAGAEAAASVAAVTDSLTNPPDTIQAAPAVTPAFIRDTTENAGRWRPDPNMTVPR